MHAGPYHLAVAASKKGGLRCGRGIRGRRGSCEREAASLMEVLSRSRSVSMESVVELMFEVSEVIGQE